MKRKEKSLRADIYERITEKIVADLEKGARPWIKPWSAGRLEGRITRPLRHTGEPYTGINVLLLWSESLARSFEAPLWMTYRQARRFARAKPAQPSSIPAGSPRPKRIPAAVRSNAISRF